ncbi:MAG: hypothetical protein WCK51_00635 [Armatimonadota bacterium]
MDEVNSNSVATFAVAPRAGVGIVCVRYNSNLSRVFYWNLQDDSFEPGQMIKASAFVTTISSDGKYFGYWADDWGELVECYLCLAHVGYFSALAWFPTYVNTVRNIQFLPNGNVEYVSNRAYAVRTGEVCPPDIITPGCPFEIHPASWDSIGHSDGLREWHDPRRDRRYWTERNQLLYRVGESEEVHILRTFERERFRAIPPPGWAQAW